jgi:hypothetical protein
MKFTRRQFFAGLPVFIMPGWMKAIASWFQPEVAVVKAPLIKGSTQLNDVLPKRVMVPTFEIVSCPTILLKEIKERRFRIQSGPVA